MAKTAQEMVIEAKARIQEIMVDELKTMLDENKDLMNRPGIAGDSIT